MRIKVCHSFVVLSDQAVQCPVCGELTLFEFVEAGRWAFLSVRMAYLLQMRGKGESVKEMAEAVNLDESAVEYLLKQHDEQAGKPRVVRKTES